MATGTLEMSWSIEGRQDAAACEEVGAIAFDTVLYDQGFAIGRWRAPCADFERSIDLFVDDFVTRSTLIDVNESAVLRRVVEDRFVILEGQVTQVVIDFPLPGSPMPPSPDAGAAPASDAGAPAIEADAGAL